MRGILREVLVWRSPARALARAGRFGGAAPPARIAGGSAPRGPGRVLQRCDDAPRVRAGGRHTNVVAAAALALLAGVSLLACARAGAQPPQVAHARQVDVAWAAGGDAPPLMRVQHTLPR
jgi:hypothetical protein